jgi:hypothetical protein
MLMSGVVFSKLKCSNCTKDVQKLNSSCYQTVRLWWELYNRECGEDLAECEGVASLILRRFSAQERNTDKIIPDSAVL